MKVKIYSNGLMSAKIRSAKEFEIFKESVTDILEADEKLAEYFNKTISNDLFSLRDIVLLAACFKEEKLLVDITKTKIVLNVDNDDDKILVAFSLLDILNTYGVKES